MYVQQYVGYHTHKKPPLLVCLDADLSRTTDGARTHLKGPEIPHLANHGPLVLSLVLSCVICRKFSRNGPISWSNGQRTLNTCSCQPAQLAPTFTRFPSPSTATTTRSDNTHTSHHNASTPPSLSATCGCYHRRATQLQQQ